jgi:UDP-N-acetylglucosamine enolpyruvyl transferase
MGARIKGAGQSTIEIEGVANLSGAYHTVLPDRIEAGTYAMAVAMAGGDVVLEGARPELLQSALDRIAESGATIDATNEGIRVRRNGAGIAAVDVSTAPFPGFPTDLQAQFMALMTKAKGTSRITETIFENRFMHVQELARFGAHIRLEGDQAIVEGVERLEGPRSWQPTSAPRCPSSSLHSPPRARRSSTASIISIAASSGSSTSSRLAAPRSSGCRPPAERGRAFSRTESRPAAF